MLTHGQVRLHSFFYDRISWYHMCFSGSQLLLPEVLFPSSPEAPSSFFCCIHAFWGRWPLEASGDTEASLTQGNLQAGVWPHDVSPACYLGSSVVWKRWCEPRTICDPTLSSSITMATHAAWPTSRMLLKEARVGSASAAAAPPELSLSPGLGPKCRPFTSKICQKRKSWRWKLSNFAKRLSCRDSRQVGCPRIFPSVKRTKIGVV